jgi:uncharacterized protein with GYD domain
MPTFVTLSNFTDQGMKSIKDTTKRAEAFKKAAKDAGVTVKELLWTQGPYDIVTVLEASDETSANALALAVAKLGNIREQRCGPSLPPRWTRSWPRFRKARQCGLPQGRDLLASYRASESARPIRTNCMNRFA